MPARTKSTNGPKKETEQRMRMRECSSKSRVQVFKREEETCWRKRRRRRRQRQRKRRNFETSAHVVVKERIFPTTYYNNDHSVTNTHNNAPLTLLKVVINTH